MNWLHSFRWRILLGTVLWTLGLIPLMHLLFLVVHGQLRFMPAWGIGIFLVFATLSILAGIWQFRAGLLPFGRLRQQLSGLRDGSGDRIEGTYPTEVQPLVNDLNSLLEHRERIVRRALAKAGDLAHGLKTPLAVLAQEAERAESAGEHETASTIGLLVDRMRRQVDYHLTMAPACPPPCTIKCCSEECALTKPPPVRDWDWQSFAILPSFTTGRSRWTTRLWAVCARASGYPPECLA
jgi:signal transduction histidine kinase